MALQQLVCWFSVAVILFCKGGDSQQPGAQIKLAGSGSTQCSGRVEIYHNNSWGRVCDYGWNLNDAEVVCRQLNCGTAVEAPKYAFFGAGTGQIWLTNVACSGNESSLSECQNSGFGNIYLPHYFDVCVVCSACSRAVKNTGSWPWHVTIEVTGQFQCGGSLITDQWVLTAASCVSNYNINNTVVYLGLHSQLHLNLNEITQTLEVISCHPNYNSWTYENDICLLKLSAPVTFSAYIQPICLASKNSTFHNGTSSWITGFGYESKASFFPKTLQEVNASIVGRNECQCYYQHDKVITENMICAGLGAGRKDSCWWDGGEPLMINNGSVWVQSGVMTLLGSCGSPLKPEISTRVSQYQMWINDTVTGMRPGFATFTSPGSDSDVTFTCSGGNLIHFIHFISLCVPVVLLHVFVGSS